MRLREKLFAGAATILSASLMNFGLAQAQTSPKPAPAETTLEEVTVTAQRYETNLQSTAVQAQVVSADTLKRSAANQLNDLTYIAPSIRFSSETAPGQTAISMRGVGAPAGGSAGPGVVMYYQDVPITAISQNTAPFDMDNIQVLQGPQGTLFGRNTLAGAILSYPELPTFDGPNGYVKAGYGSYNYTTLEGAGNITLLPDVLALRVAAQFQRRDGYIKSLSPAMGDQADLNTESYRASLLFTPTSNFKNVLTVDAYNEDNKPVPNQLVDPLGRLAGTVAGIGDPEAAAQALGYPDYATALADANALAACNRKCINYGDLTQDNFFNKVHNLRVANVTTFDITPNITLKNILGYQRSRTALGENLTATVIPIVIQAFSPIRTVTEEFQVQATGFEGRFQGVMGFYYENDWAKGSSGDITIFPGYFFGLPDPVLASLTPHANKGNSKAVYGNASFEVLEGLKLHAGYRYTWDELKACSLPPSTVFGPPIPLATSDECFAGTINAKKSKAPSWTYGVDWQATPNLFLYAVSRRGYRAPGVNLAVVSPCGLGAPSTSGGGTCNNDLGLALGGPATGFAIDLTSIGDTKTETLTDYELGMRSDWSFSGIKGRLNLTYFHYSYKNVAGLMYFAPPSPALFNFFEGEEGGDYGLNFGSTTFSGGRVKADGVQGDLAVMPTENLTLDFNVSWLDQRASATVLPAAFADAGLTPAQLALAQGVVPQIVSPTARWSYTLSAQYVLPFHPLGGDVAINYSYFHTKGWFAQNVRIPGYDLHNMRIDWENIAESNVSAGLWVRNLTNERYIFGTVDPRSGVVNMGEPRMVGVDVTYKFN